MATPKIFTPEISYRDEGFASGSFDEAYAYGFPSLPDDGLPIASTRYRVIKPLLDLLIVFLVLPVALPLGLVLVAIVRLTSRGPALYRHRRIGQYDQSFYVWKFRTMYLESDAVLKQHLNANGEAREEWAKTHKLRNDPRITPIGRFLRKMSLDEIPQLLNVLAGDMSIVGPRPIVNEERVKYGSYFRTYCYALPGITGLWQVSGRNNIGYAERVQIDVRYVEKWSLRMELKILFKTLFVIFHREGAY
jgi:lipopolysaccharide/colanic/teichoic acid biosynthesis glycosyltransferase